MFIYKWWCCDKRVHTVQTNSNVIKPTKDERCVLWGGVFRVNTPRRGDKSESERREREKEMRSGSIYSGWWESINYWRIRREEKNSGICSENIWILGVHNLQNLFSFTPITLESRVLLNLWQWPRRSELAILMKNTHNQSSFPSSILILILL